MTQIQFPISIALIGAPGSGKQAVQAEFCAQAGSSELWQDQKLTALANSGAVIENQYDTPMGVFGEYKENLWAHYIRYEMEQRALSEGSSILTSGTILENIAYGGVKIEDVRNGLQTPDQEMRMMKEMHATTTMTFLFADTFKYTFGFYLPLPDAPLIVAGVDGGERAHATRVDQALRVVFGNFGIRIQVLDEGTPEEKARLMHETIQTIMENGPVEIEEDEAPSEPEVTVTSE